MNYQWYAWANGRRYNLGKPRGMAPGWLSRLTVWAALAPRYGRLCWSRAPQQQGGGG